jgi:hypothetical protein
MPEGVANPSRRFGPRTKDADALHRLRTAVRAVAPITDSRAAVIADLKDTERDLENIVMTLVDGEDHRKSQTRPNQTKAMREISEQRPGPILDDRIPVGFPEPGTSPGLKVFQPDASTWPRLLPARIGQTGIERSALRSASVRFGPRRSASVRVGPRRSAGR